MTFKKALPCILISLLSFSCALEGENKKVDIFIEQAETYEKVLNKNKAVKITVELAITQKQQMKGYMERKTIAEGSGMIFLYKQDTKMRFWMKNTPHPLSIAFIDSKGVIREIHDMSPYSLEAVESTYSVRYALEVPQGMFKRMGIKEGDAISKESIALLKSEMRTKQ